MRSRSTLSELAGRLERVPHELSSTIVAVKPAADRGRADLIRDVVDAFRRLYGSVSRFVLMLTDDQARFASVGTSGSHSLNQLLSILAEQANEVAFVRLRELKAAIEEARSAEQLRDAIFSDAFSNDHAALRKVAAELERLDTAFIGLCVGHVLEQHERLAGATSAAVTRRGTPARQPCTEPIFVSSND
ncbi:hypothetical protein [Paraburkholderia lacunae]|uniref:hypothetical protein n=1 Tax=Paraburkholderia lacunae TaxID=2211104 RepID=UPI001FCC4C96|nr:hypothetical protein [Paraburkholderia lacunae]